MKSPRTPWSADEIALITALWGTVPAWSIGQQLHRPAESIRNKARRLHLPSVDHDMRQLFRRQTLTIKQPYVSPAEKKMDNDEESQRWCAYWRARRQERIQRIEQCGGSVV
jgi:hypothetical protein